MGGGVSKQTVNAEPSDRNIPAYDGPKIKATSTEDFVVTTTLGKGSFGRVRLARHKESNTLWALKVLKKREVIDHNAVKHVFREKTILAALSHPFIVHMAIAFHDLNRLCVSRYLGFNT